MSYSQQSSWQRCLLSAISSGPSISSMLPTSSLMYYDKFSERPLLSKNATTKRDQIGLRPGFVPDELVIRHTVVPVQHGYLDVVDLSFYEENPRVYSVVHADGAEPSQAE